VSNVIASAVAAHHYAARTPKKNCRPFEWKEKARGRILLSPRPECAAPHRAMRRLRRWDLL